MKKLISGLALLVLAVTTTFAQNRTQFAGMRSAYDYAYGVNPTVGALRVDNGNTATGVGAITLAFGRITLGDGTVVAPLSTSAAITIGIGANAETVTPTGVSCNTPDIYSTCTITANFANLHGIGDLITTGTLGLGEAVNATHAQGGLVIVDGRWAFLGGTNSTITGTKGFTNVSILDARGTASGAAFSYKVTSNGSNYAATTISWY